jgi:hypothetical protein
MEPYINLGNNSGISAYDIRETSITVHFSNGEVYLYDYNKLGEAAVELMKRLAVQGHGLNSFINKQVRKNYAAKLS